jgi:L-alanine-DL-glutamate epimerase-like enolase superfamily enzyme
MRHSFQTYTLELKHTFRVAGAKDRDTAEIGILRLEAGDLVGYGEAAPSAFWGESIEEVARAAEKVSLADFSSPVAYESILEYVREKWQPPKAFLAALDMALFDLAARSIGLPVYRFLGLNSEHSVPTSHTIGIADLDSITKKVKEASDAAILKIKLGTAYDIEIIEHVRKITDKPIRVDANEAWLKEEAVEKITWLATQNVELVEQPLPAAQIEETAWVRERVPLPIIADESVQTSADIPRLKDAFDGINIKLMKCGGLLEAIRMIQLARIENMKVMIGCMLESSLGIAAAAQLLPLVDYADLDGNLLIANDPFDGLPVTDGYIQLTDRPGLGVQPKTAIFR